VSQIETGFDKLSPNGLNAARLDGVRAVRYVKNLMGEIAEMRREPVTLSAPQRLCARLFF